MFACYTSILPALCTNHTIKEFTVRAKDDPNGNAECFRTPWGGEGFTMDILRMYIRIVNCGKRILGGGMRTLDFGLA